MVFLDVICKLLLSLWDVSRDCLHDCEKTKKLAFRVPYYHDKYVITLWAIAPFIGDLSEWMSQLVQFGSNSLKNNCHIKVTHLRGDE